MSTLKQLRSRLSSIKSTQKITKAMQTIAASKFAYIKHQIADANYYIEVLRNTMSNIAISDHLQDLTPLERKFFASNFRTEQSYYPASTARSNSPILYQDDPATYLLIIFTSERGLCGAFNVSLLKQVKAAISALESKERKIKLIIIGKKGYDALKNEYTGYIDSYFNTTKSHSELVTLEIKQKIMYLMENEELLQCQIYFNKFKNAMIQLPTMQQILPLEQKFEMQTNQQINYEYEGESLVASIIDLYIDGQINYALLQSKASEECARMMAMDNATKNAKEIINKLTLTLNRSRQAMITKELTEIIAGAEAV